MFEHSKAFGKNKKKKKNTHSCPYIHQVLVRNGYTTLINLNFSWDSQIMVTKDPLKTHRTRDRRIQSKSHVQWPNVFKPTNVNQYPITLS